MQSVSICSEQFRQIIADFSWITSPRAHLQDQEEATDFGRFWSYPTKRTIFVRPHFQLVLADCKKIFSGTATGTKHFVRHFVGAWKWAAFASKSHYLQVVKSKFDTLTVFDTPPSRKHSHENHVMWCVLLQGKQVELSRAALALLRSLSRFALCELDL